MVGLIGFHYLPCSSHLTHLNIKCRSISAALHVLAILCARCVCALLMDVGRGHCGGIKLTDDRLSKAHLLSVIDTGRERNQNAIDRHMEEMDGIMREMNRRIGELCSKSFGVARAE